MYPVLVNKCVITSHQHKKILLKLIVFVSLAIFCYWAFSCWLKHVLPLVLHVLVHCQCFTLHFFQLLFLMLQFFSSNKISLFVFGNCSLCCCGCLLFNYLYVLLVQLLICSTVFLPYYLVLILLFFLILAVSFLFLLYEHYFYET